MAARKQGAEEARHQIGHDESSFGQGSQEINDSDGLRGFRYRQVWVRWDSREVRVFNQRWEQIKWHAHLQPGQFDKVLGLGGGPGPLERQLDYWLKRAQELGGPCGQWSHGVLQRKGPLGLRSIMGLIGLMDHHSFKTLNDACASALSRGAWRLRDVRALLEQRQREVQTHLSFAQSHPLIRNLAEYGLFIQNKIQ